MKRFSLAVALVAAVLLTVLLTGCGGGGSPTDPPPPPAAREQALAVSKPGEVVALVRQTLRARHAERLRSPGVQFSAGLASDLSLAAAGDAPPARSQTLTQEQGVGEADLIASHAEHLFTLQPGDGGSAVFTPYRRAADGQISALPALTLERGPDEADFGIAGMHGDAQARRFVVTSQHWAPIADPCRGEAGCLPAPGIAPVWMRSSVGLEWIDSSDPAQLRRLGQVRIDGTLVDTRLIGNTLVVVTLHRPELAADRLPWNMAEAEREAALQRIRAEDLLPRMRIGGGASQPLVAETDCWAQPANKSLEVAVTTVSLFDLQQPGAARVSRCFVGGTEALYMSQRHLYLATTRSSFVPAAGDFAYTPQFETDLHKFAIGETGIAYRASGSISGHLGWDMQSKSLRLSEQGEHLRVISFTGSWGWLSEADAGARPASPATLTVLRENAADASLQVLATLPNSRRPEAIGKAGEQLHGVRFAGDRAYVVTFRRVDPLYVLDLSDPADPRQAGALEVPGFSDDLFALPGGLLLGVGREVDDSGRLGGVKVSLFDVADAARPAEIRSLVFGGAGSFSALDFSRHGLNLLQRDDGVARIALPLQMTQAAGWKQGLQRLEVDTRARTLADRGMAGAVEQADWPDLTIQRSLQIGDQVYYLGQRRLTAHNW